MARTKKEANRMDELLAESQGPEEILGESGLLKQLSKRLVERALAGELTHHMKPSKDDASARPNIGSPISRHQPNLDSQLGEHHPDFQLSYGHPQSHLHYQRD